MAKKKMTRRRRQQLRRRRIILAVLACIAVIAVVVVLLVCRSGKDSVKPEPVPEPTATTVLTAEPTPEPTPTYTPEPTPEPTPEVYVPINLYAPDGKGVRHRLSEYVCKWTRGKDIDCFEALASDAEKLTGKKFYDICKAAWGAVPDPYNTKIGYTLRYTLNDGREISMTIRSPKDISHTEYVECYLYDDVHQSGGFYTHLSEGGMKANTLITSIKITCGDQIAQVQEMHLGVFLYTSEDQFDAGGNYTGSWYSEIDIRRKA